MRSFKSTLLSAWAWAAPVFTAALPREHQPARPDGRSSLLEIDLQETYAQATFSVPCAGCLGHEEASRDDDALILNFKTHSSKDPCGSSNITLNGVYLPQEWNGDFATGSGAFSSVPDVEENAWFLQHDLDLEWESACLQANNTDTETEAVDRDAAQVLTVTIKGIDGRPLRKPAGFTISFKQTSPPELLRLEATPNRSAKDKANADDWRQPPAHLRLILSPVQHEELPGQASLEDDLRELRALQAEVQELHRAIREKKKHIHLQLKQEAHGFKQKLQQCDSLTCVAKTIAHKAHGAWRLLYIRFHPVHHSPNMGRPNDPYAQVWRPGPHGGSPEAAMKIDSLPPQPPPPHGHHPPPPHEHDGSHPHHGPPHGRPHGPPHHARPESPYVFALKVIVGVLCCGCLFTVIQRRCCSLRTRTERAAIREERRTVRAYRRAARRHAWRKWWGRNGRDQERIEDYEEKRSLIQEQESVLEEAMQEEIRQLRNAHGIVNSIVQAEEGRIDTHCGGHVHCHCHHYHNPPSPASSVYTSNSLAELPSRPLSRTSSLPGYHSDAQSEPPAYEEDEDRSDVVVNGFRQYTPSTSSDSSNWTPDSSVIDVSPRPSAETLRYAPSTDTGVGDVKN